MEYIHRLWQLNPMAHAADGTMTKPLLERLHKCTAKADVVHRIMKVSALLFASGVQVVNWPKDTQVKEYIDFCPMFYFKIFI